MESNEHQDGEINDSPIEQVRLTIPITDDPTLPVLTFRTWIIGPSACIILAMFSQFVGYHQIPITIDSTCFSLLLVFVGKLMAAKLPNKTINVPGTKWSFSLNPGPFNIKEHVLLALISTTGLDSALSLVVVSITKGLFHKNISFWASFMLVQTSQMLGYGFAGMFIKYLVNSPYMWWPSSLPDVVFYRTLHEEESRPKGRLTKFQFFIVVTVSSFAYSIIPGYFFPSLSALSFVCWIWKDSVTAQQIGSGFHGLGLGSFTLDWGSMTFAGNPLIMPAFVVINLMVGFIILTYIIAPIGYWTNSHNAKRFPFVSNDLFDENGQAYNVSRIINDDLTLNQQGYDSYSSFYLSSFYIYSTGLQFASEAATLTYFFLFHAREVWHQFKPHGFKDGEKYSDVHNRMMKKYETVPQWWFHIIIISTFLLANLNSIIFGKQFQLPYWAVPFGYFLAFILILPFGVINATTGQGTFNIYGLSQLIMGFMCPGKPVANLAFQAYTTSTLNNTLSFLSDFKLAHYMKIPPKSMFIAQIVGTLISSVANLGTLWWIFSTIENICDIKKLPEGSPWTCPIEHLDYTRSMIWGGVGPKRMFAAHGQFSNIYMFLIIGVIATIFTCILQHVFPGKKWIQLIHMPLILMSGTSQPPMGALHYWSMFTVAIIFNIFIYRKYKEWWAKYNYLLSSALLMGITVMQFGTSVSLQMKGAGVYGLQWWGLEYGDHCPLAMCPTAPGIKVDGCPVF